MFGSLKNVLDAEWYSNEENLYINFATLDESHIYKIFSTFVCNATDVNNYTQIKFSSDDEFNTYVQKLKNMSSHYFNTDVTDADQIITLYTCYGTSEKRLIVCAKRVA